MLDVGVDKKFVDDVGEHLQPGTSAFFIIVREANPNVASHPPDIQGTFAPAPNSSVRIPRATRQFWRSPANLPSTEVVVVMSLERVGSPALLQGRV